MALNKQFLVQNKSDDSNNNKNNNNNNNNNDNSNNNQPYFMGRRNCLNYQGVAPLPCRA